MNWLWITYFRFFQFCRLRTRSSHEQDDQQLREVRMKLSLIKTLWIIAGLFMLANPVPGLMVAVALFMTFLSFSLMDETGG